MEPELLEALRRNSGLRLDSEGRFFFHERLVENERVQALFHRSLEVRSNGEVTLKVGEQWAYVDCTSVAHFVESIRRDAEHLVVRYRHKEGETPVDPRLAFGPDGRCYLWSSIDGPPAILGRAAHGALVTLLAEKEGQVVLPLLSEHRPVELLSERPKASTRWPC
mgnify:CR=1 FL=1